MNTAGFITDKPPLLWLCVSPELREVRRRVLQTRYSVTSLCSAEDLKALSSGNAFLALVLCHSLSAAECSAATEEAHRRWPDIRIVSIATPQHSCSGVETDSVVGSLAYPGTLLATIDLLIAGLGTAYRA